MNYKRLVIVYHHPCTDGFTAMVATRLQHGDDATYLPEVVGKWNATEKLLEHLRKPSAKAFKIVYVDCCPPRAKLEELHRLTNGQLLVLDHHLTAEKDAGDLPYVYIDKTHSGAGIAWDNFHGTERPFLIDLVEDRDLWKWEIPNADKYHAWLDTQRKTYDNWVACLKDLENPDAREHIQNVGSHYLDHQNWIIKHRIATRRKVHALELTRAGVTVPAINSPVYQSEIGNYLSSIGKLGMAAIYYRSNDRWGFSLRSKRDGPNVAEIAELYGGGGHFNAAGFGSDNLEDIIIKQYTEAEIAELLPNIKEE